MVGLLTVALYEWIRWGESFNPDPEEFAEIDWPRPQRSLANSGGER